MTTEVREPPATETESPPATETVTATEGEDFEAFESSFKSDATGGSEGTEADASAQKPEGEKDPNQEALEAKLEAERDKLRVEVEAEVKAKAEAEKVASERKVEEQSVQQNARQYLSRLEATIRQQGLDESLVVAVMDASRGFVGNAGKVFGARFLDNVSEVIKDRIGEAAATAFEEARGGRFVTDPAQIKTLLNKALDAVDGKAKEGAIFGKDADALRKEGKAEYYRELLGNPDKITALLSRAKGLPESIGGYKSQGRSDRDLLSDPETPIDVIRQIRTRQRAS